MLIPVALIVSVVGLVKDDHKGYAIVAACISGASFVFYWIPIIC